MKPLLLLLTAILMGSCLKEVGMDVELTPQLLVVNCFFTNNEPFTVNVSRLAPYPDLSDRNITNARVKIFTDGIYSGTLKYVEKGNYSLPSLLPEPGKVYQITVEADGYPVASAKDSLPPVVPVDSVIFTPHAGKYDDGISYHQYTIRFRDLPGKNYYSIHILGGYYNEGQLRFRSREIFSGDPVIAAEGITSENFNTWFAFSDTLFSNQNYSLKINMGDYYSGIGKAQVLLISGSSYYYQYLKRLSRHDSYSWQDLFKPYNPVPLYSNIVNGLGIFAGFQCKPYDLDLPETEGND